MKPDVRFVDETSSFWAHVKILSENLGYSKGGSILTYSTEQAVKALENLNLAIDNNILKHVIDYLNFRAMNLNQIIKPYFMDVQQARQRFNELKHLHEGEQFTCNLPFNKQKNEKRDYAYFTGIINIITESVLRRYAIENNLTYGKNKDIFFDDNPRKLTFMHDNDNHLIGVLSRWYDGVYPSTRNPIAIWEIKEYYYTTTFGSRVADGVYETQLDGFEIEELGKRTGYQCKHIYFIDDYNTWWNMGKPYLCRIFDMLHNGLVDEVIFGREVFTRWPELLLEIISR